MRDCVVVCHDHDTILLADAVQALMRDYPSVIFKRYDIDTNGQARNAKRYMLKFGAKVVPFCGVLTGDKPVRGFYKEKDECTAEVIAGYAREHFTEISKPDEDLSFGEQLKMFFEHA